MGAASISFSIRWAEMGSRKLAATLKPNGRIVIPGSTAGESVSFRVSALIYNQATVIFSKGSRPDECEKVSITARRG